MNKAESMGVKGARKSGVAVQAALKGQGIIDALREAVKARSYANINGTTVDLFSASAVIAVFDAVNETNRQKLLALPVPRMVSLAFSALNRVSGGSR